MGALGNQLCVNSNAGQESFARQYQRSEFSYQQETEASNKKMPEASQPEKLGQLFKVSYHEWKYLARC